MAEEHHEEVVRHVVVGGNSLLLLRKVMRERGLKVGTARRQDNLVAVDGLAFHHERNVTELLLVQDREEVALVALLLRSSHGRLRLQMLQSRLLGHHLRTRLSNVAHVVIHVCRVSCRSARSAGDLHTFVAEHDAVDLLGHVDLVVTWLTFLLIGLTLLAVAVLVVSGSATVG